MKSIAIVGLFASVLAFANPGTTTGGMGTTTTPAAQGTTGTTPAATTADHGKMGHTKAKATDTKTAECKNKAADGKCMDEAVKK